MIDRVPDELWNEVCDIVQETGIKTIPMEKPPRHAHGDLTSLAPHERLPENLVVSGWEGTLGVALESLQGLRDLT